MHFPGGSVEKNPPAKAGDVSLIPGSGRYPEEGNGNPLPYSCLGNHGQRSLVGYNPWGHKRVRPDLATEHAHTPRPVHQQFIHSLIYRKWTSMAPSFNCCLIFFLPSRISLKTGICTSLLSSDSPNSAQADLWPDHSTEIALAADTDDMWVTKPVAAFHLSSFWTLTTSHNLSPFLPKAFPSAPVFGFIWFFS